MGKADKTNVMRILERAKLPFEAFEYSPELTEGVLIAEALHEDNDLVFKTLVTESDKKEHFVFVIPVAETLDLKAAAKAVGVKSVSMLKQKELLPLTGYIHGGCSPVGMKKKFTTYFDASAGELERLTVSAGVRGAQLLLGADEIIKFTRATLISVTQ
jgi:Cys-tRNA(Pro)/Cys-tRNA(Cys) deacylase